MDLYKQSSQLSILVRLIQVRFRSLLQQHPTTALCLLLTWDAFVEQLKNAGDYQRDSGDNYNWKYWSRVAPTAYAWALDQFKSADSK